MQWGLIFIGGLSLASGAGAVPAVTGYQVVADRPILEQVRMLDLDKNVGKPLTRKRVLDDVRRIQMLGTVARVHVGYSNHGGGKKVLLKVDANPVVKKIVLEGVTAVPPAEILARFRQKTGQILNYRTLFRDLNQVSDVYARRGILWADVLGPRDVRFVGGEVRVKVREFRLGDVVVRGVSGGLKELVKGSLQIKRGELVRKEKLLTSLFSVYQQSFVKDVDWRPVFDKERTRVTLVLDIKKAGSQTTSAS
jgi:outer membrane protein assembly factor BamA